MATSVTPELAPARAAHPFQVEFEHALETSGLGDPAWLLELRQAGIRAFADHGWPTTADEDYRFTSLAAVARGTWRPAVRPLSTTQTITLPDHCPFLAIPGPRLVFVNGLHAPALSTVDGLPDGVQVAPMAGLRGEAEAALRGTLGQIIQTPDDPLVGLNTAFFRDGAWVRAAAGVSWPTPIHLLFLSVPQAGAAVSFPRVLIDAGAGSDLTVIETHLGLAGKPSLSVPVVEIHAAENARVEHLLYQDEPLNAFHLASVHGRLGRSSLSILHSFALGAAVARTNLRMRLEGEGLETVLNGLYLTRDDQVADHHMVVDHASPHCASHEYFNGILNHRSRGVFHGRILVRPDAQKTDAKQTNKNLLLSDDAVANTKPQLEIYADDVKCTHGATIGQMNPESVFYLRSRGIGLENARRILMHAFAGEIIDRIRHERLRSELDRLVWERLESNALPHV